MFFLVLWLNSTTIVMPLPYHEDQCKTIAAGYGTKGVCIPAPANVGTEKLATEQFVLDNMLRCRKNHYTNKLECY